MFGALSQHYRKEEERRIAQMQQQRLAQQQRTAAALAAQNAANNLQPSYGKYISRTPQPPRRSIEQQTAYRTNSTVTNSNLGRVQLMERQMKPSRSDGSFPCSSTDEESEDEQSPRYSTTKTADPVDEWKTASIKTKSITNLTKKTKKKSYY